MTATPPTPAGRMRDTLTLATTATSYALTQPNDMGGSPLSVVVDDMVRLSIMFVNTNPAVTSLGGWTQQVFNTVGTRKFGTWYRRRLSGDPTSYSTPTFTSTGAGGNADAQQQIIRGYDWSVAPVVGTLYTRPSSIATSAPTGVTMADASLAIIDSWEASNATEVADSDTCTAGWTRFQGFATQAVASTNIEHSLSYYQSFSAAGSTGNPVVTYPNTGANGAAIVTSYQGISSGTAVAPPVATATSLAYPPSISAGVTISVPVAIANSLAYTPTIQAGATVTSPVASSTATAYAPTVAAGATLIVPVSTAAASAPAPAVAAGATLNVPVAVSNSLGYPPIVRASATLAPPVATSTALAYPPTVRAAATVTAPVATASAVAYPPSVGGAVNITIPVSSAAAQGYVPTVRAGATLSIPVATANALAYIPAVKAGATVGVPVASASGLAYAPQIKVPTTISIPIATATGIAYSLTITNGLFLPPYLTITSSGPMRTLTGSTGRTLESANLERSLLGSAPARTLEGSNPQRTLGD